MVEQSNFSAVEYANISLPKKPCLVPWATRVYLGDDRLQFRGSNFTFTLTHALLIGAFTKIRDRLDGCYGVEEIASSGGEDYFPTTIIFLLKMLRAHGLLHESHPAFSSTENTLAKRQVLFLSHILQDSGYANDTFLNTKLGLIGEGPLVDEIHSSLKSIGLKNIFNPTIENLENDVKAEALEFFIACSESPGYSFFEKVNTICLKTNTRWMHVSLEGTSALLGPTIVPFQTACYKCFSTRIESLVPDLESHLAFKKKQESQSSDEGYFPPLGKVIGGQVVMELARVFLGYSPPKTFSRFYKFNTEEVDPVGHDVLRFPRCSACYNKKSPMDLWDTSPNPNGE